MYEGILTEIGLTKSEIAVYFALLETGNSTTGPIIKKAGIASGKAYLILDKLASKGLVTHSIKSGRKHYQTKDPEILLGYLKEKESDLKEKGIQLKKIIPELKKQYEEIKYKPIAEVYEGVKAFKAFHEWMLSEIDKEEPLIVMGPPKLANEKFGAYYTDWNERRVKKGVKLRILYNGDSRDFGSKRAKMKLTEVRYLKKELETPAWIDVFKDYVVTLNVQANPVCFLIKNKESAESYKRYFEIIWNQSNR